MSIDPNFSKCQYGLNLLSTIFHGELMHTKYHVKTWENSGQALVAFDQALRAVQEHICIQQHWNMDTVRPMSAHGSLYTGNWVVTAVPKPSDSISCIAVRKLVWK